MNFCMKSSLIENECIVVDGLKRLNNFNDFQKPEDLQQNFGKIALPNSVVRSSSLSKISNSCEKNISINSSACKQMPANYSNATNQNQFKQSKRNVQNNTRQVIVNKLFSNNPISINSHAKVNNKQNHNQKQKNDLPSDHFYHKHQNADKLAKLYKEKTQKELKQCTFNPKIRGQLSGRNHDTQQFYKYQIEHTKRTQDKIQQMREMIKAEKQKQNTFKPKLTQQTIEMTHRRANANVYDRLYDLNKEDKSYEIESSANRRENESVKRQPSKKSIFLVSSRKKKDENFLSHEKDPRTNPMRNQNDSIDSKSKQLNRQKSIKTFQQMFQRKQSKSIISNQKKETNNFLYSKWQRPNDSKQNSMQNSQKKGNLQHYGPQMLDCRQLIKQKRNSTNLLSREQSCKLISSQSNDIGETEKKKNVNKEGTLNKDSIVIRNKTSQKSEKMALEKFTKQFLTVTCKMGFKSSIDFNQMVSFMKNMNFIENLEDFYESKTDSDLKSKAFQIWTLLQGDEGENIDLMNLFKVFCAIQGYTKASMIEETVKSVIQGFNLKEFIKHRQEKRLILSQKDSKAIKKDFVNFYLTRFRLGESKLYARQPTGNQFSFHPSISKESGQYADKYREKIIAESQRLINEGLIDFNVPESGLIDHSTLLILDQKIKNYKIEQKRQQTEREKRRKEEESMAHHSSTNRSVSQTSMLQKHKKSIIKGEQELDSNMFSRISHNESQSRTKDQIFTELYEQGRRSKSNRRDKSAQQIEYETNKEQLTFKPKTQQCKVVNEFKNEANLHECIPNYTKEVMRMRKNKKAHRQELSVSPLLYLNVTMQGNCQTKVPVFQTDTLHQIAEKVRVLMKIENGYEENQKLRNILKEQIIPVLDQLGMREREGLFFSKK